MKCTILYTLPIENVFKISKQQKVYQERCV